MSTFNIWTCPACGEEVPITDKGMFHSKVGHTTYRSKEWFNGYSPKGVEHKPKKEFQQQQYNLF